MKRLGADFVVGSVIGLVYYWAVTTSPEVWSAGFWAGLVSILAVSSLGALIGYE